jgi:hypothetical protein
MHWTLLYSAVTLKHCNQSRNLISLLLLIILTSAIRILIFLSFLPLTLEEIGVLVGFSQC